MAEDSGKKFNPGQVNQQQVHIRNQIRAMEKEHEWLMNSLDATQQQAWQEQIRNMNQLRQQLQVNRAGTARTSKTISFLKQVSFSVSRTRGQVLTYTSPELSAPRHP
jgi:hypothetical protein